MKELKKLGPQAQRLIVNYFDERLVEGADPRSVGKALKGPLAGLWRYRIADYRAICSVHDSQLVILVLKVGHRRDVYD
ncbi:type II toxin-antitoxin system RelE/ParE family toxin [Luteolibacter sp. Populi]|uniref:type II toxin-antitoxin system RelE family toxin n=1 Tax=Luteolibacter sp. Populi TaxID=3230487 RepID=UPI003467A532